MVASGDGKATTRANSRDAESKDESDGSHEASRENQNEGLEVQMSDGHKAETRDTRS